MQESPLETLQRLINLLPKADRDEATEALNKLVAKREQDCERKRLYRLAKKFNV